jgi:teichuronic acid biosynthesis glycosyltransferase TuaG
VDSATNPTVSILIPAYNCERFLEATIDSVLAQSFRDWEMILSVDPGSTEATRSLVEKLARKDSRIRWSISSAKGVSANRNHAMDLAQGEYFAFLDADDVWDPRKLEIQLVRMKDHRAGFSCTTFRRLDESSARKGRKISPPRRITYRRLLQQNCILCSSVMVSRDLVGDLRFQELGCEDFDFWLRLLRKSGTPCLGCREDLVYYRIVSGSRGASKWRSLKETWGVWRRQSLSLPSRFGLLGIFTFRSLAKYSRF